MPRTHSATTKTNAENLYVYRGIDFPELAETTTVSESQLRRWAKRGGWKAKRKARATSGPKLAAKLTAHIDMIVDRADEERRPMTSSEIDQMSKLQAQVDRLNPGARLVAHILEGLDWFGTFARERRPELMPELAPLISEFGEQVVATHLGRG